MSTADETETQMGSLADAHVEVERQLPDAPPDPVMRLRR